MEFNSTRPIHLEDHLYALRLVWNNPKVRWIFGKPDLCQTIYLFQLRSGRYNAHHFLHDDFICIECKSGKPRKTGASALCTVDGTRYFHVIRLGPKTSVYHMKVIVVSTVTGDETVQQHYKGST